MKIRLWHKLKYELPALLWAGVIFAFSSQEADQSSELSSGVLGLMLEFFTRAFGRVIEDFNQEFFHFLLRKGAHFTVYLVLGVLVAFALYKRKVIAYRRISFLISVLYAVSDEIHQVFVPGRAGQVQDVLIDASGALLGILLFALINTYLRQRFILGNPSNPSTDKQEKQWIDKKSIND